MATEGADTSSLDPSNVLPDYTALNEGADLIDKLCGRIHAAVQSATDGFIAAFAGLLSMTNTFKANARSLQRRRSLWLDKQREEFDSVKKFLLACARLACTGLSTDLLDGLDTALTLLGCDTLPRYSGMTSICDNALGLVSASLCTRVQTGVSPSGCSSSGPGLLWCEPGWSSETAASHNVVTVTCGDEFGEGVRGLTPEDFLVEIVPESINSVVTGDISGPSEYTFMYKCNLSSVAWENEIHLRVCILGQLVHTCTVPVGSSLGGKFKRSIQTRHRSQCWGLAVSPDCTLFAVSGGGPLEPTVILYSLPSGTEVQVLGNTLAGGAKSFRDPRKICFSAPGTLLVADGVAAVIQEVALSGEHIRCIGEGILGSRICGIAASQAFIAAGSEATGPMTSLFDSTTGQLVRTLGVTLPPEGYESHCCVGLRFSVDGRHLFIADNMRNVVYECDMATGAAVGELKGGFQGPRDVAVCPNGDVVVIDAGNCELCVCPKGSAGTSMTRIGGSGRTDGCFVWPMAIEIRGNRTFVLDASTGRVQEFE